MYTTFLEIPDYFYWYSGKSQETKKIQTVSELEKISNEIAEKMMDEILEWWILYMLIHKNILITHFALRNMRNNTIFE